MANLRDASALTTSYVASSAVRVGNAKFVSISFDFTWGSATSVEWYYAWASTSTGTARPETVTATTGATTTHLVAANTLAVTASAAWVDRVKPQGAFLVVYAKRTGGSASDALTMNADPTE